MDTRSAFNSLPRLTVIATLGVAALGFSAVTLGWPASEISYDAASDTRLLVEDPYSSLAAAHPSGGGDKAHGGEGIMHFDIFRSSAKSLITQQPLGGQRFGEMEVWLLVGDKARPGR